MATPVAAQAPTLAACKLALRFAYHDFTIRSSLDYKLWWKSFLTVGEKIDKLYDYFEENQAPFPLQSTKTVFEGIVEAEFKNENVDLEEKFQQFFDFHNEYFRSIQE